MRTFLYNIRYYLVEAGKTIRFNLLSNIFSVVGTGLILFLLGMVYIGASVGEHFVTKLQEEAEISVYYQQGLAEEELTDLMDRLEKIHGVWKVTLIREEEAQQRMKDMLGEEGEILSLFEHNPFESFIEVRIDLELMDSVTEKISFMEGIEYQRDNRTVLTQLQGISEGIKVVGYVILLAVAITTIVIISHMIRQGIYENREQINTLGLLGAPSAFINFPFVLVGIFLTLCGGGIAILLVHLVGGEGMKELKTIIPFLPMPSMKEVIDQTKYMLLLISLILGLVGSLFGLSSIGKKHY